jgi:hypothetical protein
MLFGRYLYTLFLKGEPAVKYLGRPTIFKSIAQDRRTRPDLRQHRAFCGMKKKRRHVKVNAQNDLTPQEGN